MDDEYVRERPRWVAELENGVFVYQDDDRPGVVPPSAWLRLRQYLADEKLRIRRFWLQFRSNRIQIGEPFCDGYFFTKLMFAVLHYEDSAECHDGCVVGVYNEGAGEMWVYTLKLPELSLVCHPELRDVDFTSENMIDNRK